MPCNLCGITGFTGPSDHQLLTKYTDRLTHRGPDSSGYYENGVINLGVRRLRVIDLVTGDQPMHNEDETIWVVFNGEIYNYRELRIELENHCHKFYTESDTEVLVHLYEDLGLDMVKRLRGMFAFALFDSKKKRLLIVRDRFGKKPLFYSFRNGELHFASELKSLLVDIPNPKLDRVAYAHFLTYFYNPLEQSMIRGVYRLLPASYLIYDLNQKSTEIKSYWDVDYSQQDFSMDSETALDLIDKELTEAVRIRMVSDVPLGVFLSGGVDSSIIASLMTRFGQKVKTFSVGFSETDESEHMYAKQIAELLGTDHTEFLIAPDILNILPEVVASLDEPIGDHSIIPTFILSKEARRFVTVALTGDGGDEAFYGYPWLNRTDLDRYFSFPNSLRFIIRRAVRVYSRSTAMDLQRYEEIGYRLEPTEMRLALRLSHTSPKDVSEISGESSLENPLKVSTDVIKGAKSVRPIRQAAYLTVKQHLPYDFLSKNDQMSMANSLEQRCPFLDHIFFQKSISIPDKFKKEKHILKLYAIRRAQLPAKAILRPKKGFAAPIRSWTKNLESMIPKEFAHLNLQSGSYQSNLKIFALVVFSIWREKFGVQV